MPRTVASFGRGRSSIAERAARLANREQQITEEKKTDRLTSPKITPVLHTIQPLPTVPASRRLRVAAYCRISDDTTNQQTSILNQCEHWREEIAQHSDWELVDIYWEVGVSGTKKETRPQLMRLMADCEAHRVDMVVTKSVSRFARNTSDCLELLRRLKSLDVSVWFQKENINTATADGELMLTLYASFSEEESHSIQKNTVWGIQRRFQDGTRRFSRAPYGYDLVDGNFVINPDQAPIVREIFDGILSGKGTPQIARELNERKVPTGTRKRDGTENQWLPNMVRGIVKNVVYIGDVLMQKTFHDEHFKRFTNYGERQQFYVDDHHPAIVDSSTFEAANAAISQRGKEKNNIPQANRTLRDDPHQRRYAFSGNLKCGCCGSVMKRAVDKTKSGTRVYWVCTRHLQDKESCPMKRVLDDDVKNAFLTMMNKLSYARDAIIPRYAQKIQMEEMQHNEEMKLKAQSQLEANTAELNRLTASLRMGGSGPINVRREVYRLESENKELRHVILSPNRLLEETIKLKRVVLNWGSRTEWDENTFSEVVESVVIRQGESICFCLKCGMRLTERLTFVGGNNAVKSA